jgi:hypothetical protein
LFVLHCTIYSKREENAKGEEKVERDFRVLDVIPLQICFPRCSPPTLPSDHMPELDEDTNDENCIAH